MSVSSVEEFLNCEAEGNSRKVVFFFKWKQTRIITEQAQNILSNSRKTKKKVRFLFCVHQLFIYFLILWQASQCKSVFCKILWENVQILFLKLNEERSRRRAVTVPQATSMVWKSVDKKSKIPADTFMT